jgi:hypothetical protein
VALARSLVRHRIRSLLNHARYDSLNRLVVAAEGVSGGVNPQTACLPNPGTWCQKFGYDQFGNRWVSADAGVAHDPWTPASQAWIDGTTNRLTNGALGIGYL